MLKSSQAGASERVEQEAIRGYLHRPKIPNGAGLVLTHGAGGDLHDPAADRGGGGVLRREPHRSPMRSRLSSTAAERTPSPSGAAADRDSLREAIAFLKKIAAKRLYLGGQSYGGRQASLIAAEHPGVVDGLLLLSYPLHLPGKPAQLRTAHFPMLRTPSLFVSGTADPFGSAAELEQAIAAIPARTQRIVIDGAGHDLRRGRFDLGGVVAALLE